MSEPATYPTDRSPSTETLATRRPLAPRGVLVAVCALIVLLIGADVGFAALAERPTGLILDDLNRIFPLDELPRRLVAYDLEVGDHNVRVLMRSEDVRV